MDQTSAIAASGMRARMDALDMLSNNLANSTTGGFKVDREFYTVFSAHDETHFDGEGSPAQLPEVKTQWTDFSQGTLQPTGSPLDMALSGKGFFSVNGPNGPLYTRNGSFQMSSSGVLTTQEGYAVSTAEGKSIQTQSQAPITVSSDGTVTQDGQPLGQLAIVNFQDTTVLSKLGASYYVNSSKTAKPTPAPADTVVAQTQIEGSNVAPAESAVRLVSLMRQFEMLQKAISLTSDMDKKSLDEVARVGGL